MNRYRTRATRPLALLVLALLVWIGAPLHANSIPTVDTDTPALAPVENVVGESRGEYVTATHTEAPQNPLLGLELWYMICYHLLQGCDAGCKAVVEALLAMGMIDLEEADGKFIDCVRDYCPDGSVACLELFPGLGF